MAAKIDSRTMWNEGAGYGMILGLATGVFIFLNMGTAALAENGGAGLKLLAVALNAGLWLVKFLGCLWLMRFFMLKFAAGHKGVDNRQARPHRGPDLGGGVFRHQSAEHMRHIPGYGGRGRQGRGRQRTLNAGNQRQRYRFH